jgi:purine/pyrimidine-nucleoside phosphorylase
MTAPEQFENVIVKSRANVYFDGKVVSYTVSFSDGSRKSLGIIHPGSYTFSTAVPERMEIIDGHCRAKVRGDSEWTRYEAGTYFDIPADSSFEIAVEEGLAQYVCSFG